MNTNTTRVLTETAFQFGAEGFAHWLCVRSYPYALEIHGSFGKVESDQVPSQKRESDDVDIAIAV